MLESRENLSDLAPNDWFQYFRFNMSFSQFFFVFGKVPYEFQIRGEWQCISMAVSPEGEESSQGFGGWRESGYWLFSSVTSSSRLGLANFL